MTRLLRLTMFGVACVFLVLGVTLPIIRFDRLYFFSDSPSLIGLVAALWQEGDTALSAIVALFSITLPVVKLAALGIGFVRAGTGSESQGLVARLLPHLAKWSMMDVMLVAIVIFAAKTSGMAQAVTQSGLWFYAGSALLAGLLPMIRPKVQ